MIEIERKILDINQADLIKKIQKLTPKAKKLFDGMVRVEYWDFDDGKIRKRNDLLRIREFTQKSGEPYTEFVYKKYGGIKGGAKFLDESEVKIPGLQMKMLGKIFSRMGLTRTAVYEKKRIIYSYTDVKFEIDQYPRIPLFLEIEGPSPKRISQMVTLLDLTQNEQTAESISQLLRRKYPKISLNGLVFH